VAKAILASSKPGMKSNTPAIVIFHRQTQLAP